jgi:hypothetical protein
MPVSLEQAVYGSFPFWDKGYAVLAHSPGCRPEWLAALKGLCQQLGERPPGAAAGGLCALRLAQGPWVILGMSDQGSDDRGRPGALAFHALFLSPKDYDRLRANPFRLADRLRRDWGPDTSELPPLVVEVADDRPCPVDPRADRIASALARGGKVALEADGPIDDLARAVWHDLPLRARRRATVATWAFANGPRFDLVALPRLGGERLDPAYVDPDRLPPLVLDRSRLARLASRFGLALVPLVAGAVVVGWLVARRPLRLPPSPPDARGSSTTNRTVAPPLRPTSAVPDDPVDEAPVQAGLMTLADRFGLELDRTAKPDTTALMIQLANVRYSGPWLTAAERAALAADPDPEADRALAWEAHLRRFAPDRPLPPDFATGPLRWQLEVLTWSFHLEPDPHRPAAEVPAHLADRLAVDVSTRPSPFESRYPALRAYARFLDRLPRR